MELELRAPPGPVQGRVRVIGEEPASHPRSCGAFPVRPGGADHRRGHPRDPTSSGPLTRSSSRIRRRPLPASGRHSPSSGGAHRGCPGRRADRRLPDRRASRDQRRRHDRLPPIRGAEAMSSRIINEVPQNRVAYDISSKPPPPSSGNDCFPIRKATVPVAWLAEQPRSRYHRVM